MYILAACLTFGRSNPLILCLAIVTGKQQYSINNPKSIFEFESFHIDTYFEFTRWFEFYENKPKNVKMDTLREFFGLPTEGAHDALVDIRHESTFVLAFLKHYKRLASDPLLKKLYKK